MAQAVRFAVKKQGSGASSIQTDTGNTTVTGDTLIVCVNDPVTNLTVTDTINGGASGNSSWTQAGTDLSLSSTTMQFWYHQNANGGTNHRVTVTASGGSMDTAVFFLALSGMDAASFDKTAQGTTASSPYGGTVATGVLAQANEIVVAFFGHTSNPTTITQGAGYTMGVSEPDGNTYWTGAVSYKLVSATTSESTTFTVSNTPSEEEAQEMRSKFNAVKTDGYASKREAKRAQELKLLAQVGEITDLREQVPFELIPKQIGERACKYVSDFVYRDHNGVTVVEDVKGFRDPVYRLKRKLMLQVHGIRIREV